MCIDTVLDIKSICYTYYFAEYCNAGSILC